MGNKDEKIMKSRSSGSH